MLPFGIGFSEVLLILVVVLLVVGPQKLPEIARTLGKGIRTARRAGQELRDAIEIDDIRRSVYDNTVRPWQSAVSDVEDAVLDEGSGFTGATSKAAAAVAGSIDPPVEEVDELHDPDEATPSGPVSRGHIVPAVSTASDVPATPATTEDEGEQAT